MKKVNEEFLSEIIEKYDSGIKYTAEELDNFYCEYEDGTYTACFNEDGHAYCEDFKTITGVILYLESDTDVEECRRLEKMINGHLVNLIQNQLLKGKE